MTKDIWDSSQDVAALVRRCLEEGRSVEIDGLGVFRKGKSGAFEFQSDLRPAVFIAYVEQDMGLVRRLYCLFKESGFEPWVDRWKLLPGQNWPRAIEQTIARCDFFVPCFSVRSVSKRGQFQAELRYALECAARSPLDDIFIVPVRLDDCQVPARVMRELHYVDLFPELEPGFQRVARMMKDQLVRKRCA
jgi:TIR domain